MGKKINKKLIIVISILTILIIAIIIALLWFYSRGNIPKKYRGTWITHIYSVSDDSEKTYNLKISKDKIEMDSTPRKIEYEFDGDNLIIVYVNQETNEKYKQYLLLSDDTIYVSKDKKIDNLDLCYFKEGSESEHENILQARADYYANNIEELANQDIKEVYQSENTISIIAINDLTNEQKSKQNDLNYYYAFYNAYNNTVEIAINRSTGKLENIRYTENLSSTNTYDDAVEKTTSVLSGICCMIYLDNSNVQNINNSDELTKQTAKLHGSVIVSNLLKKAAEEKTYVTTYEDNQSTILLSIPIYKTSGTMSVYVSAK